MALKTDAVNGRMDGRTLNFIIMGLASSVYMRFTREQVLATG